MNGPNRDGAVASGYLDHVASPNPDRANGTARKKDYELLIGSYDARSQSHGHLTQTTIPSSDRSDMKRSGPRWVRKSVLVDQRKLAVVRQALGAKTDTEAINLALDLVVWHGELEQGFAAVRRSGGIEDVFGRRRQKPSGV